MMISVPPEEGITPDRWVAVQVETEEDRYTRIIAGWVGGYFGSDSYRISTPIVEEREDEHNIRFSTESGSTYICNRNAEGFTPFTRDIYDRVRVGAETQGAKIKVLAYGDPT